MTTLEEAGPLAMRGASSATADPAVEEPGPFAFGRRDHLINLAFWTLFGAVTAANLLSDGFEPSGESRPVAEMVYWLLHSYVWAAATPLIFWLVWRFGARRGRRLRDGAVLVGAGVGLTALVDLVQGWLWEQVRGFPSPDQTIAGGGLLGGWPPIEDEAVMCAAIYLAGFLRQQLARSRSREEQAMRLQARAAQLQAQLAQARLAVLRSQLNPHFLFNSLNALSALLEVDTRSAQRMLARLSELLRYALKAGEEEIPLAEELKMVRRYLEILEIRFPGTLNSRVTVAPEAIDAWVPSLILQPLIENAMKHGVGRAGGRGWIEVEAYRADEWLVLKVSDTGCGEGDSGPAGPEMEGSGTGLGLENTRARLQELYGSEQDLRLALRPGGGMIAEVRLPFRGGAEAARSSVPAEAEEGAHA